LLERIGDKTSISGKTGAGERNQTLSVILADVVREVVERLDPAKPSVFVTHVQVYGVKTVSERELTYRDDICLSRESLPVNVSYIALGHIHQAQQIEHVVPCWFSGSFDRMDLGERDDEKCVLLVDVTDSGPANVTRYPIEMTPFVEVNICSDDLEDFATGFIDRERTYVRLNIECASGTNPLEIHRRARELFARCVEFNQVGEQLTAVTASAPASPKDYKKTVMEHLESKFAEDADLPELKARAELLIQEVSNALATN
jgi:DNA repair exonuclease SbcCD nuclease subunit